jgi:Major Facilitator Superfamily
MAVGVALLVLFVLLERRTAHPMLDVGLFRNPRFTAASGSVAISFFALQGFIFLVTQYFQFIKAFSPLGTGVRLLPVATAVAVASVAGTRLAVRAGNKVIVANGLLFFAAGILWTATVSASTSYATIALQMLVLGTGMGLTSAPATEAIMGAVPKAKAGAGSAVNDATRLFGGTLGVAVIGSVAASLYSSRLASTAPGPPAGAGRIGGESVGRRGDRRVTRPCPSRPHPFGTRPGEQRERRLLAQPPRRLRGGRRCRHRRAIMAGLFLPARPAGQRTPGTATITFGRSFAPGARGRACPVTSIYRPCQSRSIPAMHHQSGDTGRHRVCRAADPATLIGSNR